jgi:hypothetical protein
MALQQIPQDQWAEYFDDISRQYESGEVSIDVRGDNLPQQQAISPLPFLGISYETKGSGAGRIDIMFGGEETANTSHAITSPLKVMVQEGTPIEAVDMIQIDGQEGEPTTIVHFLSAT